LGGRVPPVYVPPVPYGSRPLIKRIWWR